MDPDPQRRPPGQPTHASEADTSQPPPASISDAESRSASDPLEHTEAFERPPSLDKASPKTAKDQTNSTDRAADIPTTLGRFKINGVLGTGGFGRVYLGFDERLKRNVAIKVPTQVLTGLDLDNFLEEAQRVAQLRHPGIVTVFDVGEFDGRCYIVSDYLEGISLADWMQSKPCTWRDAALLTAQLADALAHAHANGTVHRDIKPSNVMMLANDQPVLIDFGLAISDAHGASESPGMISGTLSYMSPEQATGKGHRIDGRTDIYGLGVVLYRLLSRKLPYRAKETLELLRQIRDDDPQPLRQIVPDIPIQLEQVCLRAMAKRINDRYMTAADFATALRRIAQTANEVAEAPTQAEAAVPGEPEQGSTSRSTNRLHEAERRQITTLYLDLDDSDVDADDLDPEELRNVVQRIREITGRILTRYGGHLAHSSGEAIQVYFGYPRAQEDSARQAVLAGLEISTEIKRLEERLRNAGELMIDHRIGIHTGIVVTEEVGADMSSERHSIVGNVPRVAAGLAALAEPGAVVISGTTQQIVGGAIACHHLGTQSGKAIGRSVDIFQVIGVNELASADGDGHNHTTPLVGRAHEIGLLNQCWEQAGDGAGQIVLVSAEAGVGKSRLLSAFRQELNADALRTFEARCSPYHQNSALHPIREFLRRVANFHAEDSDDAKLQKLEDILQRHNLPLAQVVPLFVDLVSIPLGPRYPVFEGTPERRKQKTIEALVELMLAASEAKPLLLTIEDVHWVDPTTLDFLTVLIDQIPSASILLMITFRPEFTAPWAARAGLTQLTIGSLTPQQTADVVTSIAGDRRLPTEVIDHIVAKTGGVPLFTEELTKVILESDILKPRADAYVLVRPLASVSIPNTLQDSLMARLDKLGTAKEIAQLAAVIGREFTYQLLTAIAPLDEATLQTELTHLVNADLVHQRGFFPRARFTFKHALVQDTAYTSLLRSTRGQWHGRIAEVLAAEFPEIALADPALLARHHTEAGQTLPAIDYWERAGLQAQERSAHHEAISHFRAGLALVASLPDGPDRETLEFKFQIPLGVALLTTQGYAAPDVGPVFDRAQLLGQKLAGPGEQFFIHWGIWAWRVVREELAVCHQMTAAAQRLVAPLDDAGLQTEALFIPALTSLYLGDFETSRNACEKGFAQFDDATARIYAQHTGQNVGVTLQCYWALSLWHLGYPDQALGRIGQAIELARAVNHPFSLAYALCHSSWLYHNCRLSAEVMRAASEGVAVAHEQGFPFWLAEGLLHQGFAHVLDREREAALRSLQAGLQVLGMTGAKLSRCHFSAVCAEAHLLGGDTTEALRSIDEATQLAAHNGNVFYLAEIHRLHGEIMRASNRLEDAETCFQQSLEVARSQHARSWELRTTMSLGRLWQSQQRHEEAHAALTTIYDWFEEGFQTPDLIDAAELLKTLRE